MVLAVSAVEVSRPKVASQDDATGEDTTVSGRPGGAEMMLSAESGGELDRTAEYNEYKYKVKIEILHVNSIYKCYTCC